MLIDTQKSFKDLSHKNSEMEAQYSKRVEEKDCELKQLLGKNQAMLAKVHELETLQQLMKKEAELQLVKARQQQTGMATKLSRLQKDRRREDEFSKAFQQEFDANKVLRAKCSYLQKQLDSALDAVDVSHWCEFVCHNSCIYACIGAKPTARSAKADIARTWHAIPFCGV